MKPWHRPIARAFALLASAASVCVPIVIRSQGEWTPLKLVVAVGSVFCALLLMALAFGPDRWWTRVADVISTLRRISTNTTSPRAISVGYALIAVAGLIACAQIGWRLSHPDDPWDGDDQGAFLSAATEIAHAGGPLNLLQQLWSGEYEEANRHPLYTGMLSLQPTEPVGRILSAVFALLTCVTAVALAWQRFGPLQAGLVAVLFAVNSTWGYFAGMVVCESLLMWLSVLIWWQCLRLCDASLPPNDAVAPPSAARHVRRLGPLALGALLGLNYLTKGTGVVLIGCVMIWFAWECLSALLSAHRRTGFLGVLRAGVLTLIAFLLVSSPLIARNVKRYGQPFYNINTYLLFADQYEGFEELLAQGDPVGQVAREYFTSHTAAELVQREATGLMWQMYNIVRMLGPVPFDDARILFGVPLLGLAMIGVFRAPPAHRRWLATWIVLQWLVFAWYVVIAAGDRFILGVLPPLLVYAADGIVAVWTLRSAANSTATTGNPKRQ